MNEIKCKICGKKFEQKRPWQVYCSTKCIKKGKIQNAITWREKQPFEMEKQTVKDVRNKEQYRKMYEKIMNAFKSGNTPREGLSWTELFKKSKSTDKTIFNLFVGALCRLDMLKKENGRYFPYQLYKFEPLRLRANTMLANIDLEHSFFHPSPGFSYSCYNPDMRTDDILSNVNNLKERLKPFEDFLNKAQKEWFHILDDARNNYLKGLWNKEILIRREINPVTKFVFALDTIFKLCELKLYVVSPPEKTSNQQMEILMKIKRKAFKKYIQERYPKLNSPQVKKLLEKAKKEYRINEDFYARISKRIKDEWTSSKSEFIIVIDFPAIGTYELESLKDAGLYASVNLDGGRPIGEIRKELNRSSDRNYEYLKLENSYSFAEWKPKPIDEKLYIKIPFFKDFFLGFEDDLLGLGFKRGEGIYSLETFYIYLDRTTEVFKLPSLPDIQQLEIFDKHRIVSRTKKKSVSQI